MMETKQVSKEDGIRCANLIKFLTAGRWDFTGTDVEEFMRVRKWVHDLAQSMATNLRETGVVGPATPPPAVAPASGPMKIKAMGPLGAGPGKRKKK